MITKQRGRNQLGSSHVGGSRHVINQLEHLILPMRYLSLIQCVWYLILICITTITTYVISKGDPTCGCEWLMKVKFTLIKYLSLQTRHQMSLVFYFPDDLCLDRKNKSPGSMQFIPSKSRNKVVLNKSRFTVYKSANLFTTMPQYIHLQIELWCLDLTDHQHVVAMYKLCGGRH